MSSNKRKSAIAKQKQTQPATTKMTSPNEIQPATVKPAVIEADQKPAAPLAKSQSSTPAELTNPEQAAAEELKVQQKRADAQATSNIQAAIAQGAMIGRARAEEMKATAIAAGVVAEQEFNSFCEKEGIVTRDNENFLAQPTVTAASRLEEELSKIGYGDTYRKLYPQTAQADT